MRSTLRRLPALAAAPSVALLLLACVPCLTAAPAAHAETPSVSVNSGISDTVLLTETDSETASENAREQRSRDGYFAGFTLGVGLALADRAAQSDFTLGNRGSVNVTGRTRNPDSSATGSFRDWSAGRTAGTRFAALSTPAPNPEPGEWLAMGMMGTSVLGLMLRTKRRRGLASNAAN